MVAVAGSGGSALRCHWRTHRKTEQGILVRSGMFDLVEHGMLRASEHVAALVATGLMEGLIAESEKLDVWREIEPLLGTQSRSHATVWIDF